MSWKRLFGVLRCCVRTRKWGHSAQQWCCQCLGIYVKERRILVFSEAMNFLAARFVLLLCLLALCGADRMGKKVKFSVLSFHPIPHTEKKLEINLYWVWFDVGADHLNAASNVTAEALLFGAQFSSAIPFRSFFLSCGTNSIQLNRNLSSQPGVTRRWYVYTVTSIHNIILGNGSVKFHIAAIAACFCAIRKSGWHTRNHHSRTSCR